MLNKLVFNYSLSTLYGKVSLYGFAVDTDEDGRQIAVADDLIPLFIRLNVI